MLRILCIGLAVVALAPAPAQVMTEVSAAATGGLVGGAAGKPVSEGVSTVFGKVDKLMGEAADDKDKGKEKGKAKSSPALQIGAGQDAGQVPRAYSVPDPPPLHTAFRRPAFSSTQVASTRVVPEAEPVERPLLLAPEMTVASLQPGMDRGTVSKVQSPAVRITMYDDGHLVEVYRYKEGVVRIMDGAVESVQLRPAE